MRRVTLTTLQLFQFFAPSPNIFFTTMASDSSRRHSFDSCYSSDRGSASNSDTPAKLLPEWDSLTFATFTCSPGLVNTGLTCFMNAVLQCLVGVPCLAQHFKEGEHSSSCSTKPAPCILCVLEYTVTMLVDRGLAGQQDEVLHPTDLEAFLLLLFPDRPTGHQCQEDAHEFLTKLVDLCSECTITAGSSVLSSGFYGGEDEKESHNTINKCVVDIHAEPKISRMPSVFPFNRLEQCTLFRQAFGFQIETQTSCGHHVSTRSDFLIDLALEIANMDTLEQCLAHFTRVEPMVGENAYCCDGCAAYVDAERRDFFREAPQVLAVSLKRFLDTGEKDTRPILFPVALDLRPFMTVGQDEAVGKYELCGVVVHNGSNIYGGHYTAYVKSPSSQWHFFDDEKVKPVDVQEVLQQQVYLVFYNQVKQAVAGTKHKSGEDGAEVTEARKRIRKHSSDSGIENSASERERRGEKQAREGSGWNSEDEEEREGRGKRPHGKQVHGFDGKDEEAGRRDGEDEREDGLTGGEHCRTQEGEGESESNSGSSSGSDSSGSDSSSDDSDTSSSNSSDDKKGEEGEGCGKEKGKTDCEESEGKLQPQQGDGEPATVKGVPIPRAEFTYTPSVKWDVGAAQGLVDEEDETLGPGGTAEEVKAEGEEWRDVISVFPGEELAFNLQVAEATKDERHSFTGKDMHYQYGGKRLPYVTVSQEESAENEGEDDMLADDDGDNDDEPEESKRDQQHVFDSKVEHPHFGGKRLQAFIMSPNDASNREEAEATIGDDRGDGEDGEAAKG
ncbi:hypothetical protein BC936DRAFT_141935 [Jimgerdemannia flammicorona]|uniref:ubiquitinyl hydrolase 1 n=1 Tax=Jimgerdemannia flammicorona TaxID=994334 RepID=A0A433DMI5_9FUNG|nr:hypothetical protein BC936DRAFT_141935 [Jimgerdemannia flammicorona]